MKETLMKLVGIRNEEKKKKPTTCLATDLNSTFIYQSGADVQKTWRKYGWTPPSEDKRFQEKWDVYRNLSTYNERKNNETN